MNKRIRIAQQLMERQMDAELSIEKVAAAVNLSVHHFHRLFVEETGEPPAAFLRRIRMDAAALRLKWADEPAEAIAHALGFRSRPAFIRAFERQFGVPPARYRKNYRAAASDIATLNGHRVSLSEIDSFHLLTKRYIGDIFRMAEYWEDFLASVPSDIAVPGKALYVGLLHDDYRVTDPDKVRYDCGITVNASHIDDHECLAAKDLHLVRTREGRYATIDHRGHFKQVPNTYDLLLHRWMMPKGIILGAEPAIEVHTVPRNIQNAEDLAFTILLPVE